jgi:hypothetical protein
MVSLAGVVARRLAGVERGRAMFTFGKNLRTVPPSVTFMTVVLTGLPNGRAA